MIANLPVKIIGIDYGSKDQTVTAAFHYVGECHKLEYLGTFDYKCINCKPKLLAFKNE